MAETGEVDRALGYYTYCTYHRLNKIRTHWVKNYPDFAHRQKYGIRFDLLDAPDVQTGVKDVRVLWDNTTGWVLKKNNKKGTYIFATPYNLTRLGTWAFQSESGRIERFQGLLALSPRNAADPNSPIDADYEYFEAHPTLGGRIHTILAHSSHEDLVESGLIKPHKVVVTLEQYPYALDFIMDLYSSLSKSAVNIRFQDPFSIRQLHGAPI